MKIKQLLTAAAALVSTAQADAELKPFSLDPVPVDELPIPDGMNVTFVGPDAERRRILPLVIMGDLYEIIKGTIGIAGNMNKDDGCDAARLGLKPSLDSAMANLISARDGLASALKWDGGDVTLYAGYSQEFGFIRSWGQTWGYFLDSDGHHGCFQTECWGWGLMAQMQSGAMAGILFGDHNALAGESLLIPDPVIDLGLVGPIAGMGYGITNPDSLPMWEIEEIRERGADDFYEFFLGGGWGVELLKGGECHTTTDVQHVRTRHVCFDIENHGHGREWWRDDELEEESRCEICAAQWENGAMSGPKACKIGIYNHKSMDCIEMPETFSKDKAVMVTTSCGDMLWVDRVRVHDGNGHRDYGSDNQHGWCLSTDEDDYVSINKNGRSQYVPGNTCWVSLLFTPGQSKAWGWHSKMIGCTYREGYICNRRGVPTKHALTSDLCLQKCDETPGCKCAAFKVEYDLPCYLYFHSTNLERYHHRFTHAFHMGVDNYNQCKNKGKRSRRRIDEYSLEGGEEAPASLWNVTSVEGARRQ